MKKKKSDILSDSRTDTFEETDKLIKFAEIFVVVDVTLMIILTILTVYCTVKGI